MPDYGNKSYWDERYAAADEFFDWHQSYSTVSVISLHKIITIQIKLSLCVQLKEHIGKFIIKDENFEILIPGCGNSRE